MFYVKISVIINFFFFFTAAGDAREPDAENSANNAQQRRSTSRRKKNFSCKFLAALGVIGVFLMSIAIYGFFSEKLEDTEVLIYRLPYYVRPSHFVLNITIPTNGSDRLTYLGEIKKFFPFFF